MARRPTLQDLARAAGVGSATVDRALNGRGNASARSIAAIIEAAKRIGYPLPASAPVNAPDAKPQLDLGFVLHKPSQSFYQRFAQEITQACAERTEAQITVADTSMNLETRQVTYEGLCCTNWLMVRFPLALDGVIRRAL